MFGLRLSNEDEKKIYFIRNRMEIIEKEPIRSEIIRMGLCNNSNYLQLPKQ